MKEAKLLNGIKHPNIPSFSGFSDVPYALMMEYVAFDFALFGFKRLCIIWKISIILLTVNSTLKSLMMSLQSVCEISCLEFLHDIEIAHRDLKPSNILVSNQQYAPILLKSAKNNKVACARRFSPAILILNHYHHSFFYLENGCFYRTYVHNGTKSLGLLRYH